MSKTCRSFDGTHICQFPANHGGQWHGVFRAVSEACEHGAFKILWRVKSRDPIKRKRK